MLHPAGANGGPYHRIRSFEQNAAGSVAAKKSLSVSQVASVARLNEDSTVSVTALPYTNQAETRDMHLGRSYRLTEFLVWTRRQIYALLLCGSVPVILYKYASMRWLSVPLTIVVLLGTATSFIVGFKNVQTYNRAQDAQIVWTSIVGVSRRWGQLACAFPIGLDVSRELIFRHLAWLPALRYELRSPHIWESMSRRFNLEYRRHYHVPEWESALGEVLTSYLSSSETARALASPSATAAVLSMQSDHLKTLHHAGNLILSFYLELQRAIGEFIALQANAERLKNFPYPR